MRADTPRRSFLARLGALMAVGATTGRVAQAQPPEVETDEELAAILPFQGEEKWLTSLHGSRRQVFDAVSINEGFGLRFTNTWIRTMRDAYQLPAEDVSALIVMRHGGIAPAFNDAVWEKYKLGALFNVQDPKTSAPALRNLYNSTAEGDWSLPSAAVSRLVEAGTVVAVCNVATQVYAGRAARAAGLTISGQDAYREWAAGLLPGCHLAPSGVLAVHRAQAAGNCTYCYTG
jgi:hypothetical protein